MPNGDAERAGERALPAGRGRTRRACRRALPGRRRATAAVSDGGCEERRAEVGALDHGLVVDARARRRRTRGRARRRRSRAGLAGVRRACSGCAARPSRPPRSGASPPNQTSAVDRRSSVNSSAPSASQEPRRRAPGSPVRGLVRCSSGQLGDALLHDGAELVADLGVRQRRADRRRAARRRARGARWRCRRPGCGRRRALCADHGDRRERGRRPTGRLAGVPQQHGALDRGLAGEGDAVLDRARASTARSPSSAPTRSARSSMRSTLRSTSASSSRRRGPPRRGRAHAGRRAGHREVLRRRARSRGCAPRSSR